MKKINYKLQIITYKLQIIYKY